VMNELEDEVPGTGLVNIESTIRQGIPDRVS
jgi:hypothetical protein